MTGETKPMYLQERYGVGGSFGSMVGVDPDPVGATPPIHAAGAMPSFNPG